MKNYLCPFACLIACLILTSCATPTSMLPKSTSEEVEREVIIQKQMVIKQATEEEVKVYKIAYPILKSNVSLCPEKGYRSGFNVWNKHQFPWGERTFVEEHLGIGDALQVRYVLPKTAASRAGLKKGDVILSVNDTTIPEGKNALKTITMELNKQKENRTLKLTILRNNTEKNVTIKRDRSCDYGFVYLPQDNRVNAFADGKNIYMTRGMYRFAKNNNELALVIAHELGHNAMDHIKKKEANAALAGFAGLMVDLLAASQGVNTQGEFTNQAIGLGAGAYSVEFEQEADYVGMYILAKSGRDTSQVTNFWRRMAAENNSGSITTGGTHPSTPERFLAIEKTHKEIAKKRAAGKALVPNLKKEQQD